MTLWGMNTSQYIQCPYKPRGTAYLEDVVGTSIVWLTSVLFIMRQIRSQKLQFLPNVLIINWIKQRSVTDTHTCQKYVKICRTTTTLFFYWVEESQILNLAVWNFFVFFERDILETAVARRSTRSVCINCINATAVTERDKSLGMLDESICSSSS